MEGRVSLLREVELGDGERGGETCDVLAVIGLQVLDFFVHQRRAFPLLDHEPGLSPPVLERARGQQDVFDETDDAVAIDLPRNGGGFFQLPPCHVRFVEQVDLRVRVGGGHLAPVQAGHHGVHQMGAFLVAELGQLLAG